MDQAQSLTAPQALEELRGCYDAFIQKLEALSGTEIDLSGIYPAAFPNYTVELIQTLQEKHFHERTFK